MAFKITPHEYYQLVNGKAVDVDGAYISQCYDAAMDFMIRNGGKLIHCTATGYVKDLWNLRKTNGILNFCVEVSRPYQDGDIIIFGNCSQCPYSHIGIFRKDNGNGTFVLLGANQGGAAVAGADGVVGGKVNQVNFSYSGIIGALRLKCAPGASSSSSTSSSSSSTASVSSPLPSGFTAEQATFTLTESEINVRDKPSTSSGKIVATYEKGEKVNYDCFKAEKSGYVWISYVSSSGKRRYMAVGKTNAKGVRIEAWGTFN